jgi:galactokinase/galacturonokinase
MTARQYFARLYPGAGDISTAFCPYRVCPIGAHCDHQLGKVTGFAINKGITIAYSVNYNGIVELTSLNFDGRVQFQMQKIPPRQFDWADYLRGAASELGKLAQTKQVELPFGICAVIEGSLPIGGLSSSAAVTIAFLSALCRANNFRLSEKELIQTALLAENNYVGVSIGALDQSCEVYGKKDHLLYLDTIDNSYELIPANPAMKPYEIAIFFSGVERSLASSKFNMRVDEIKSAAYALLAYSGADYGKFEDARARAVAPETFAQYKHRLPDSWRRRAEHYYSEFARVERGVEAWRKGDIHEFGKLSFESGRSSIYNWETGSAELIALYEIMLRTDGIYGGRFSGAGFKGCCMALVDPAYKDAITRHVTAEYLKTFPQLSEKFSVYFCHSENGVTL